MHEPYMSTPEARRADGNEDGAAPLSEAVPLPQRWNSVWETVKTDCDAENGGGDQECVDGPVQADPMFVEDEQVPDFKDAHQETDKEQNIDYESTDPPVIPPPLSVHPTTMMVRQASRRITQEDFLRFWQQKQQGYDLLYAVFDLKKKRGTGRVVINFENYEGAAGFRNEFDGLVDPEMSGKDENDAFKPLIVEPAEKQGFQAQVAHWECHLRRDVDAEFTPAIFIRGERRDFWQHAQSLEMATRHQDSETGLVFL